VNTLWREICVECIAKQLNIYSVMTKEEKFAKAKEYIARYNNSLVLGKQASPVQ